LQLFQDLHRLNRFAPAVRKELIDCLTKLDVELSDSSQQTARSEKNRRFGGALKRRGPGG
jgi:hypothetical protein